MHNTKPEQKPDKQKNLPRREVVMQEVKASLWENLIKEAQKIGLPVEVFSDLNRIKLNNDLLKFVNAWTLTADFPVVGNLFYSHRIELNDGMITFKIIAKCYDKCGERDPGELNVFELTAELVQP